ncbi:hypothetical protein DSO57_1000775 [Entomophthora muscae]|uniref:Uncharacterized protein n=1 Tax=Entomophthora muscae TaxID=34485 RepID=A0ACC2T9D6_9FUNG|nr:hypothetical protein DSO57_1000775 [Entomophthora muscae]
MNDLFFSNLVILFAFICEFTTQYNHAYMFPPGSAPVALVKPSCTFDLEFFHPQHLDLPPGHPIVIIPPIMKEIPLTPPFQNFSKLGVVYITLLGLADQLVPHTESWHPLATAVNYLVRIVPIVYMAFQARPASPVGVQSDSGMGRDTNPGLWASGQNYSVNHPSEDDIHSSKQLIPVVQGKFRYRHRH